ncbi:putative bifunctional diguanylate cyclase/phosphodiesterase [Antrihabitans stalactiti]|uniref:EAL domain-containing protein n=1 Tax=Antrihabitans stalactiti TaxID=2584121 RepID=A0A848KFR8_9NOCA|nr:EAL domain-containing protein [Antrihabitans stalactiti]NMN96596.1 EAL domain-containing protein [Antrihabitans stalactiti]
MTVSTDVGDDDGPTQRERLDLLVTDVATTLMGVVASDMVSTTEGVLDDLRHFFGVDHVSLRHTDHHLRASVLIAESPPRSATSHPDPSDIIYFESAGPVVEWAEQGVEPRVERPGGEAGGVSFLAAPLVSGDRPTGFLNLSKSGDRAFSNAEVDAMRAIAALFAQLKARIEAEERLLYTAQHDDLTGLSNRRALLEYMEQRLQAGQPGPVATLFIDLDRLKALNDFLGHTAGDQFIHALAKRLRDQTDPHDMIARLGGDEFVIVPAKPMTAAEAEKEAERVRQLVGERVVLGGEKVSRSVSIGVAVGTPGQTSVTDVLRQADHAVLAAKTAGGNGIAVFTDELRTMYALRDDVELHLRHAVENNALLLHYQPEVDLRTGKILAVEALVRWQHPTRGLLLPGTFIEVAEATNVAGELGRWVIREACQQFAQWRAQGMALDLVMRINVSPVQLVSLDFVSTVAKVLMEFGLAGSSICLEITEHVVVQDLSRTRITLEGLRRIGVQVAIDDFGTGYSSLSHLKALTVGALKVDQGFVHRLGHDTDDLAIVKSIVGLAKSFDLDLVAEGVETEIAARTLVDLGCYRAQGFLLSRPLPPVEIAKLLKVGSLPLNFLDRRNVS